MAYWHVIKKTKVKIYCLESPINKNKAFYVGATILDLDKRLKQHIAQKKVNQKKLDRIAKIKSKGKLPTIRLLEEVSCKDAAQKEYMWYLHFKNNKHRMCNGSFGNYTWLLRAKIKRENPYVKKNKEVNVANLTPFKEPE